MTQPPIANNPGVQDSGVAISGSVAGHYAGNSQTVVTPSGTPNTRKKFPASGRRVDDSLEGARLHGQLHALSTRSGDESEIRSAFRQIVIEHTGAVGVGHLVMDDSGDWDMKPELSTGRLPRRHDFVEKFAKCCSATIQRNSIQIESFLGLESIYAPIKVEGSTPEVLMVLTAEKNAARTLFVLEVVSAYFSLWLKQNRSDRSSWKLNSLAALIELVSQIENEQTVTGACQVAVAELARYLNSEQVAIGIRRKNELRVEAVSGNSGLKQDSETFRVFETALNESILRGDAGCWPAEDGETQPLMLGHQQIAQALQCEAVFSSPLTTLAGKTIGALIFTGQRELVHGDRLPNFARASTPRIANAIDVVTRGQKTGLQKLVHSVKDQAATVKGRIWCAVAAIMLAILLVPVPYRVRCNCATEAIDKRYSVAPFEGVIKRGYVEPGDQVTKGQLLASMDGQSLRYELAGITAELNQAKKKREIELSSRNIPASLLADLEAQRLAARKSQLEHQQNQIEIRSPFDGVILSGSLEHSEGASVEMGKVLYEVAPLDSLKIEVSIPANEIAYAKTGQRTRVWIDGLESESIVGQITRIHPRSQLGDGKNVFIAEVTVENPHERLRPGMHGHARIDCSARPLAWNLFHKPWHFITSRLTWW